jgi:HEAT repeat protein
MILKYVDDSHLPIIVKAFGEIEQGAIFDVLLKYISRVAAGQESVLGDALPTLAIAQAMKLIHILAEFETSAAREAISKATRHTDPVVRIEALGHIEGVSSERLRTELRLLLQDKDPGVRLVALKAMEDHTVLAAGPFLALRVKSPHFGKLPIAERQQAFATLATLAPGRTEAICLEVLEDARLVASAGHEETRAIAAETLGCIGSSRRTLKFLDDLAKRRWKNTERVRQASREAIARLEERGIALNSGEAEEPM